MLLIQIEYSILYFTYKYFIDVMNKVYHLLLMIFYTILHFNILQNNFNIRFIFVNIFRIKKNFIIDFSQKWERENLNICPNAKYTRFNHFFQRTIFHEYLQIHENAT